MYRLLIKQFFRSKTVILAFGILMILGGLSITTGKQFLHQKQEAITKTAAQQKKHITVQKDLHKDDLGLLLYYLKFSFVKPLNPLAGIAIGQSDINTHIQNVKILNLEGQKYDTDLVNPMHLQVGNLDLSFLIIFLFPLVIIALTFNLLSEEVEKGTWKMITIHGKSALRFLLMKLSIRIFFIATILMLLFILSALILGIEFNKDFLHLIGISYAYILFWFAVCFLVIVLRNTSNTNAIILLSTWLLLVVFLPVLINNYVRSQYPIEEAFTMTIKKRDEYHKRWDTNKQETMDKFYKHYPQFSKYTVQEEGFSWLWYYAMQQMGDDESKEEREAMYAKINNREQLSTTLALFFPPLQVQLAMNAIAKTSLTHHVTFLDATTKFHEELRLQFYPKIFENNKVNTIDWNQYHDPLVFEDNIENNSSAILPILLLTLLLISCSIFIYLKN